MARKDASRKVRFLIFDGRLGFPILLVLIWPRLYTLYFLLGTTLALWVIERRGMPVTMFLRRVLSWPAGGWRLARPWWRKNINF